MTMKTAILQVADTGPVESLIEMLESVGYECYFPNDDVKSILRGLGCDTVLDIKSLVDNWGYENPIDLPLAPVEMLNTTDLYVDVKAVRNAEKIWRKYPYLKDKTLWYRINGGEPEIVPGCGDEINPPCPILTPNLWYKEQGPWSDKAYSCWPPFFRFHEYLSKHRRPDVVYSSPVCLTHNLQGWGYDKLIGRVVDLGVRCYGAGSPSGLLRHTLIPSLLSSALCLVHLKDSDSPGYSLYEALAAGCPLIVSETLIWRNRMYDLFKNGETCYTFGKPSHDSLTPEGVNECERQIKEAMEKLNDPVENRRIGMNGHNRLQAIMWNKENPGDVQDLSRFMERMYP